MKFFLRTAFGDSREFAGLTVEVKTQGLGQGNAASLAGWCILRIMILQAHGAKGQGAHFIALLSQVCSSLSAILYVDDTDLLHLDMDGNKTVVEVHAALQHADNWGKLLIVMGGTLKPDKCFFHLINFQWTWRGGWQYVQHHKDETAAVFVPLPDGLQAPIQHRAVDDAQKTLGISTCPSESSTGSLKQMKEKTEKWLDALTGGQLHCHMMWFSVDRQLWPSVKYGLCCSMAILPELESVLLSFYSKILPLGGIVQAAPKTGPRILWPRPPTSRGGGNCGAVKQTADALWLPYCSEH
jgi:hypothetical protein